MGTEKERMEVEMHSVALQQKMENWCLINLTLHDVYLMPDTQEVRGLLERPNKRNLYDMFSERSSHFESEI